MYNRDWKKVVRYMENQVLGFLFICPPLSEAGLAELTSSSRLLADSSF